MLTSSKIKYVLTLELKISAIFDWDDQPTDIQIPQVKASFADTDFNPIFQVVLSPAWSAKTAECLRAFVCSVQHDVENTIGASKEEEKEPVVQISLTD